MKTMFVISILSMMTFFTTSTENFPGEVPSEDSSCRLQLVGLKCINSEGLMSADAIYFEVDNGYEKEEWPRSSRISMYPGDYRDLTGVNSISFDGRITFEMWDDDTFDSDDHLGTKSISCVDKGAGEKYIQFSEDGAYYKLYYKVF